MTIKKGEIYGFLGSNGAGKSTIMKLLMNLIKPSRGDIELFGSPLTETSYQYLHRIGSMIETYFLEMTALENLELHCAYMGYHDRDAILEVLDWVGLSNDANKITQHFSLGMRQRLSVARAIITKPELVILDEPINGLDPEGIQSMRILFKKLNKEYGMTFLISSHIIGEIEQIADTVGMIKQGRLIEETSMEQLKQQNTEYVELVTSSPKKASVILHDQLAVTNFKLIEDRTIRIFSNEVSQASLTKALILGDVEIESIRTKQTTLEDYFIHKIGLQQK
ncbi:LOW QUALITY PROTEIN: bacitracin ABC transporter, ATP-binding protein [Bacillus sp. JCM 19046]|nr:LOW QUALITY PROTEIN: bacitracin ABC transporter, ATP-binding protein [Bacillus sp. JCM 19046]